MELQRFSANIIIIIMYIYHALINTLSAHTIHINLNTIFYVLEWILGASVRASGRTADYVLGFVGQSHMGKSQNDE